jgi:hypothetical protein
VANLRLPPSARRRDRGDEKKSSEGGRDDHRREATEMSCSSPCSARPAHEIWAFDLTYAQRFGGFERASSFFADSIAPIVAISLRYWWLRFWSLDLSFFVERRLCPRP